MQELSATEMLEWRAYYDLEPFGPPAEDWRSATISTLIAETNRDRKKKSSAYTQKDFMLVNLGETSEPEKKKATTTAEMLALAELITLQFGGTVARRG